jgi:phosphatidyl-myo-inositol alpha-mannosyltransferase
VLDRRVFRHRLDVLHLHGDDWFYVRRSIPTVRTFHGSALNEAKTATSRKRRVLLTCVYPLERLAARLATASYAGGHDAEALYRTRGLLPYGVDMSDRLVSGKTSHPTVLFVGTWKGRKRGWLLHDAFMRDVAPFDPSAELWMVSDHAPSNPRVRWWEAPPDDEVARLYRSAWVFCLPSTYEGFGIPYLEAMANGTSVVATPNSGAALLLGDSEYGAVVSDAELGACLRRLLKDRAARERWARAGRLRAGEFTWDRVVAAHEEAYREAIARWRRRPQRQSR